MNAEDPSTIAKFYAPGALPASALTPTSHRRQQRDSSSHRTFPPSADAEVRVGMAHFKGRDELVRLLRAQWERELHWHRKAHLWVHDGAPPAAAAPTTTPAPAARSAPRPRAGDECFRPAPAQARAWASGSRRSGAQRRASGTAPWGTSCSSSTTAGSCAPPAPPA